MSLASRLLARLWRLPRALEPRIAVEPLRIPVRDGAELLADRYYSRREAAQPTVLIRSCYGRSGPFRLFATLFAERGMQVVIQSCRGTGGSQGVFRPFFDEQNDGEDTVDWIERQPWHSGQLALWGASYLGNTAWAIAASPAASRVRALGLQVTLADFRDRTYAFGGFTLEACIGWTLTMRSLLTGGRMNFLNAMLGARRMRALIRQAAETLPLRDADRIAAPGGVRWWQDWMDHAEPDDSWWDPVDYGRAAETLAPTVMIAGWHDIFLPWQLRDFTRALRAGRDVRIVIGPWMHAALPAAAESVRRSVELFQQRFGPGRGADGQAPHPRVRLFLAGANQWRDYPGWPIPGAVEHRYYLGNDGELTPDVPASGSVRAFDYDPARPTPSLHGPSLAGRRGSGNMAELERRADLLIYSTAPLAGDLDVIGPVFADIFLRSSSAHTDLYLCLCDVVRRRSCNVCDGYIRLRPAPEDESPDAGHAIRPVRVEFWPTAYRFVRGHRVRLIVASGAHPRYARNPGSGEPLGDARSVVVAHQQILHGPQHPSAIRLPISPPPGRR